MRKQLTIKDGKILTIDGKWLTRVQLLRKVSRHIQRHSKQYDQNVITARSECGTVACIGGWCCILTGRITTKRLVRNSQGWAAMADMAKFMHNQKIISRTGWPWLFSCSFFDGPSVIARAFENAKTHTEFTAVALQAINAYIKQIESNVA